ncbi:PREDICTED: maestro heat-like repeat-containing protein family member 1 [Cyphomyrmex costatus]|uniref:HEAT repeat-containing protein 7A n=1 Tax=Cyphomyrmex costatus TaxID=456900 RepID=A0A151IIS3_9HYME|nr:PREDICTED: maestro heat-like repeat-containing protein family member 1 [Cyphomyrmex costatus]XP_018395640.1 PREDICTED: maestro heat-like repeat-containing protein family member 1 [Cyphomyrmex costatus]KYN02585.1 HEAT repeat-containing protein 7A [Cyphomyrmex costatus]
MKEEIEDNYNSELPAVIGALLDTLNDRNQDVKQSVIESIEKISKKNPEVVIHAAIYFWEMHKKISTEHMGSLLNIISNICKHSVTSLNVDLVTSLAEVAVNELIGETENEAAELLIELCKIHCMQATGGLLTKLEPGVIPNPAIVFTIGKLAAANPYGMLSFVKITLTIMLPMLNQIREEILKQAICFMISKFCEAINDYITNGDDLSLGINKQTFVEEICSVFDFLINNWLKTSRDSKSTEAILTTLVPMVSLLPVQQDSERIVKLIPICLNLCRKQNIRLAAVRVVAMILSSVEIENDKEAIRAFMEPIHQTLSEFVSIRPFEAARDAVLTHYEVLQCSRSLVVLYPEEGLDRILQQLKSPISHQRARALVVLRHLINTLPPEDDGSLQRIALSLQESLGENGALQMVGAIVALAARPTFPLLPSQRAKFVRYMVSHCEIKSDDMEACSEALYLLATTVDGVESWLWPCLISALLDSACIASVTSVLRSLSPLATRIIRDENSSTNERDFPGTKVLGRCLELLSNPINRPAVIAFLKSAAPLVGHQVKPYWDEKLQELSQEFLHDRRNSRKSSKEMKDAMQLDLIWEKKVVEWLEESVKLEGESWGTKLADELALKVNTPGIAALLASTCNNNAHITLLVELARSHGTTKEYARAVGICAKRHLSIVLKLMEEFCTMEDTRKAPVRLLGFVKDTKAAATAEIAKAGLLQSYAEIAQKGDPQELSPVFEKHVIPWTIKQLHECKELSSKEAGLSVLEQVANAVHPARLPESKGLRMKATALATLLGILQSSTGYRPLQLYPAILKAANSLIRIPPILNNEERQIFLGAALDKTISASSEIVLQLHPEIMQQVVDELGTVSSEIVSDSADALSELIDILLPWMQSKSIVERKNTLLVLHTVLQSYYNSLKYTYPGGKLDAGKLVGRTLCWCADTEFALRPLAIDCMLLSLDIAARHRHVSLDNVLNEDIQQIKKELMIEDSSVSYGAIQRLANAVSQKIPNGEIVSLAEGLIEGLLFYGEASLVAGIALSQHFQIKGSEISRTDVCLVESIIAQMRQMENASCRYIATVAIVSLMKHHPEEVIEHLLSQPLPLDPGTALCWKEIGNNDFLGPRALDMLLIKLESNNLFSDIPLPSVHSGQNNIASLSSLAAIVGLKHLLESSHVENLIAGTQLAGLLSILLKYLSGWLHVEAPASVINTKYGYVPNRAVQKINPRTEVYSILTNILVIIQPNAASNLPIETTFASETQAEESLILTVRTIMKCISTKSEILSNMTQYLGKLMTSTIARQRAVAATFYSELIGKIDCGPIWLDAIINTLHDAKIDSSSLVRKLATIGLARIAYLDPKQVDEYFDNCMEALLDGLEETAGGEGGAEVVLESLRGLSVLLSVQYKRPISPRVVLALKPFLEKENWEMKLAAIDALGAIATNWQKSVALPNDDLIDHLLGCLPSLIIRLEDSNTTVVKTAQETLCKTTSIVQSEKLSHVIRTNLGPQAKFSFKDFSKNLIKCLKEEFPQRAEELRNAVVRGYSKSENYHTRATSALLLGLFDSPRPEDIQRLLQLLRDRESIVRMRASQALSFCFTL